MIGFKSLINQQLQERQKKNPKYSCRSFAKKVGISHTSLSCYLKGSRTLSLETLVRIAEQLEVSDKDLRQMTQKHEIEAGKLVPLETEVMEATCEWHYDSILELTRLRGFKGQAKWIAQRLGLSLKDTNEAIKKLLSFGLLKKNKTTLEACINNTTLKNLDSSSEARRHLIKQGLSKAIEGVDEIEAELRDNACLTMAISKKDLPTAKKLLKEFRRKFMEVMQEPEKDLDEVYQLNLSFTPVSKLERK